MSNRFSKVTVRKSNRLLHTVVGWGMRAYCALLGLRIHFTNKCAALPRGPAVILCTHGSFIDFAYAGICLKKCFPHFVIARLYFYNKWLSRLLKTMGSFPKSMFALDIESTKNSLRVLRSGEVLIMMPEARLSTVGKYEDIQSGTFSFLKKAGVPVYSFRISGNYFADPKWGKGIRKGSPVECELELLFDQQDLQTLSLEQIQKATVERMQYDEFRWLESRPDVHYDFPNLAEGIEYVLTTCPVCGRKYTVSGKGRDVLCSHCGKLTTMDDRYGFQPDFRFRNFAQWYDWQTEQLRNQIDREPDFTMESEVELRLPSSDGKSFTRSAGHGVCTLDRSGLTYRGTCKGESCTLFYPLHKIYRLLFSANGFFQLYQGTDVQYFIPKLPHASVDWYVASMLLYDEAYGQKRT